MKPTREQLEQYARENPAPNGTWLDTAVQTAQWAIEETLKDCIEIPDVSKWPDWATGIQVLFTNQVENRHTGHYNMGNSARWAETKYIPRPQQPIKFKVGDPVFWKQHLTEIIFRITAIDDFDITISSDITAQVEDLKPAKLEDLGKEWEAIK